ncbi:MAG: ATP-binding protein [Clostridia bacterium]|nr:ATP-binding protein [Clostridia bacterium]
MEDKYKIPKRILTSLLSAMSAGVVPRVGAPYIAIGRTAEISALCRDLDTVADGGSVTRFIIGHYGSGKSFLIQLMRGYSVEHGFVCADADLSPERRLSSSGGGGLATYRELIKDLSIRSCPDGGALQTLIEKWLSDVRNDVISSGVSPDEPGFAGELERRIYDVMHSIETGVGAFDFAKVIVTYYRAYLDMNDERMSSCLRWLRGEFTTRTEARAVLGVTSIINDDNWYDYIKLLARFVRVIGYGGLIVFIDECVNLFKIPNRVSRENNYEKILSIFNDTLQGKAEGLCVIFAGTPQFLEDKHRGLFSYEALRSRLNDTMFTQNGGEYRETQPMFGPVMRLKRLSNDELLALIARVTVLFGQCYGKVDVEPEQMKAFLDYMLSRVGADVKITPRELIRSYLTALGIIMTDKTKTLTDVCGIVAPTQSDEPDDGEFDAESIRI